MAFLGLFLTSAEKMQKERERKKACERGVSKGISVLADAEKKAATNQERYYQEGKKLLSVGRTVEARTQFQFSRMQMAAQQNYVCMRLMWEHALTQFQIASSMQTASACFQDLVKMSGLQIANIDNALNSMEEVQDFMVDVNKAFEAQWDRQNAAAGVASGSEADPGIEAMMSQAEREIAAEIGGISSATNSGTPSQR